MSTSIKYNGDTLSTFSNATKRLTTAGTWLTGNIEVTSLDIIPETGGTVYQDAEGYIVIDPGAPTGVLSITQNGTYSTQGYGSASVNVQPSLQQKSGVTPTTSSQTITADTGYYGLSSVQINAMPSGTAGTPTASKGTVSNHSVSVTPSVTNTTGYITGGTKTGTAVTVTASELASGNKAITANGTGIDVVGYSTVSVAVDATYTATITGSGNASYCYVQLNNSTKYYTNGGTFQFKSGDSLYCYARYSNGVSQIIQLNGSTVNSGTTTASYTYTMPAKNIGISLNYSAQGYIYLNESVVPGIYRTATTITPSTSSQTIAAGSYAAGAITISAMPSGSATTPATTITSNPTISVSSSGLITASNSKTQSVTPTVSAGYVSSGTAGTITVSGSSTNQLTTQGATTITPSTSQQTAVSSGTYVTGNVVVSAMPSGSAKTPATTITANPTISVNSSGLITATTSASQSVTPTVTSGYVSSGTAGTITVSGSKTSQLTTQGATTLSPGDSVSAGTYLTGVITAQGYSSATGVYF